MSETVEQSTGEPIVVGEDPGPYHRVPNRAEKRRRLRQWGEPKPLRSRRQRVKFRIERQKSK